MFEEYPCKEVGWFNLVMDGGLVSSKRTCLRCKFYGFVNLGT